jgi:hypothetical protein
MIELFANVKVALIATAATYRERRQLILMATAQPYSSGCNNGCNALQEIATA